MDSPGWLQLLGPLPADEGQFRRDAPPPDPSDGGEQIRFVAGDKQRGLRVVTATYHTDGRPGRISDLVMTEGGQVQECARGAIASDGRVNGTHWRSNGDTHAPRALTEQEQLGLRELAAALRKRCARKRA